MRPFRKLLQLDARGWRDLLRAQWALLAAARRLRRVPIGQLAIREPIPATVAAGDPARVEAIARAVRVTADHGLFHPYCLVRAIALRDLLRREGIEGSSIRIGARRHAGAFQAHAWVVWNGRVLADEAQHVATFTEIEDLRLMQRG